ncbi:MAG: caspase family protein [Bacteroidales bacterium]
MATKNFPTHKINYCFLLVLLTSSCFVVKSQSNTKGASALNSGQTLYADTKAIIVGVSDYVNIQSLNYAHTDAQNVYNFLISDAGGNVNPDNIVLLLNSEATSANIYAALDWLVDEAKEGERIIIYFSGHGDLESKTIRQNGFLLGHDSPKNCYMSGGTVGVGYLQDYLETIALKSKSDILLITDACRSGKLAGGYEGASNTTAALAQNWNNITKVLSFQAGEFSFEGDKWKWCRCFHPLPHQRTNGPGR